MKNFTISAPVLRAAMACQSVKDTRYYLNGVLLRANGDVVGTNGHILFKGKSEIEKPESDVIISINGKIPPKAETVTFTWHESADHRKGGMCITDCGKGFSFSVIDGTYPDIERAIPKRERLNYSDGFGMQAQYLARIMDVFGKKAGVIITHGNERDPVLVEYSIGPKGKLADYPLAGAIMVIMPALSSGTFTKLYATQGKADIAA